MSLINGDVFGSAWHVVSSQYMLDSVIHLFAFFTQNGPFQLPVVFRGHLTPRAGAGHGQHHMVAGAT